MSLALPVLTEISVIVALISSELVATVPMFTVNCSMDAATLFMFALISSAEAATVFDVPVMLLEELAQVACKLQQRPRCHADLT